MSTLSQSTLVALPRLDLSTLRRAHGLWAVHGLIWVTAFALLCVFVAIDDRTFQDVSVWKKPAKFSLSVGVYLLTLAWFAAFLPQGLWQTTRARIVGWIAVGTAGFEMIYIVFMAALGDASHFNTSTPITSFMYTLMGIGAVTLTAVSPWLAFELVRAEPRWRHDPFLLAVVLGLLVTFLLGAGFGGYLGSQTSHWVNAPRTDAGGLPLFDWSRQGGDLRVAHFFGLHAMQVLPLFALAVRGLAWARTTVVAFSLLYSAVTVYVFVQAVQGQPFLG